VDTPTALDWLLASDPAIRWVALRDLTNASPGELAAERARVSCEGVGAEILAAQELDGAWRRPDAPTWLTTLFTLQLLRATGVDPADRTVVSALDRAEANLRWNDYPGFWDLRASDFGPGPAEGKHGCKPGGNPFFEGEEEPCINGGVLAFGAYFGRPNETLAHRLLAEQLPDGGWNCEAENGSTRASFNTTICVLEALLEYELTFGTTPEVTAARLRGQEYLLGRRLFKRKSTGEVIYYDRKDGRGKEDHPAFTLFAFPTWWHYDVLRGLEYLRRAGVAPDERVAEAIDLVASRRDRDGRWPLEVRYPGTMPVEIDDGEGRPSRWNTLRALRVLRWYDIGGS